MPEVNPVRFWLALTMLQRRPGGAIKMPGGRLGASGLLSRQAGLVVGSWWSLSFLHLGRKLITSTSEQCAR